MGRRRRGEGGGEGKEEDRGSRRRGEGGGEGKEEVRKDVVGNKCALLIP